MVDKNAVKRMLSLCGAALTVTTHLITSYHHKLCGVRVRQDPRLREINESWELRGPRR